VTAGWDALWARGGWEPIAHCPGRFVARAPGVSALTPAALLGADAAAIARFEVAAARHPVLVAALDDGSGGLITYARGDGSYLHTLNSADGFRRKLAQLGITLPG
jgi:hypothetical protein